ncbi:MAG: type II toxin-antitoxin system HigB family toxin [Terriglobia bacterium]
MRVISRRAINDFARKHSDAKAGLDAWYHVVGRASWRSLADLKLVYPHADQVGRRTVFNIKGNSYRLIARVNYRTQRVFVLYILTHSEYDRGEWKQ